MEERREKKRKAESFYMSKAFLFLERSVTHISLSTLNSSPENNTRISRLLSGSSKNAELRISILL